jgi:site-specific recombinase XerD
LRRIPPNRSSTGEHWEPAFAAALSRAGLAPLTIQTYRHEVRCFVHWLEERTGTPVRLQTLAAVDLLSYRQHLINVEQRRPATVNKRLQALRWLCRWAQHQGIVEADPAAELKSMRVARRRQPAGLTEPEVHALLRLAGASRKGQRHRNYAIVQLLLQTGLRVGELVNLEISDITLAARSGWVRVRLGKGERERELPLNASARRALRLYLDTRAKLSNRDPLFTSQQGEALSERSVQALIQTLARRAKLTRIPISPHTLRHTFALSYLQQNPGKLVELAHLLGHESLDTTAIYTQPAADDLARDLERGRLNVYG